MVPASEPRVLSLALAALIVGAGCLGGGPSDAPMEPAVVEIVRSVFMPGDLVVPAGTTVQWSNQDPTPHTVTPDDAAAWGSPGSGDDAASWIQPGASWAFTFRAPATYAYHCIPHSFRDRATGEWQGQVGRVVVEGA